MIDKQKNERINVQIVSIDEIVPAKHLLRKIEKALDFDFIYDIVKDKYSLDKGRPSVDPVVLVKMVFIQHLCGIRSLHQTTKEIDMNMAYRWFLGYDLMTKIPHFSTISYNFLHRFTIEVFEGIFEKILVKTIEKKPVAPETIFIDAIHVKANANRKKKHKEIAQIGARVFDEQLREEIEADRRRKGRKPLKNKDDDGDNTHSGETREVTISEVDPYSGIFR